MCVATVMTMVMTLGVGDVVMTPSMGEPQMVLTVVDTRKERRVLLSGGTRITADRGSAHEVPLLGSVDLRGLGAASMECAESAPRFYGVARLNHIP